VLKNLKKILGVCSQQRRRDGTVVSFDMRIKTQENQILLGYRGLAKNNITKKANFENTKTDQAIFENTKKVYKRSLVWKCRLNY
jgi:hypothetical protein